MTTYTYLRSEPALWTVGVRNPDGSWEPESDHSSPSEAANRVHWLNGGCDPACDNPHEPTGEVRLTDGRPEMWDPSVPPGGWVCAVPSAKGLCGLPVESEPCTEHYPWTRPHEDDEPFYAPI